MSAHESEMMALSPTEAPTTTVCVLKTWVHEIYLLQLDYVVKIKALRA